MIHRTFERGGRSLAWYDSGGTGLPVVFQHGLGGDVKQTREAFPADDRFRLITLECRGHGASEVGPFSIADFADDVAALIEAEGLAPVVLGGISMGAAIASRLAVTRPELVHALLLVRPAWVTAAAPSTMQPNAEVGALMAALPAANARAAFGAGPTAQHLAVVAPDNLASLLGFFSRQPAETMAALLQAIAADGPGIDEADLRALVVPTLVLGTDKDFVHPFAMAERLAELIPGATLVRATPKAVDKASYLADLHAAIGAFLEDF